MRPDDPRDDLGDDPMDSALVRAAAAYHRPPDMVPKDAMWDAIAQARAVRGRTTTRAPIVPWQPYYGRQLYRLAAAVLLVAFGTTAGWWAHAHLSAAARLATPTAAPTLVSQTGSHEPTAAYRVAVARDLTDAEVLLTTFQDDGRAGKRDAAGDTQLASWARDLLTNTRLLLDSPAAASPQRRQLLEDLELVLVQMVELGPDHRPTDRQFITHTIDHDQVLTRLRSAVPAGATGL